MKNTQHSVPGATVPKTEETEMSAAFERVKAFLETAGLEDWIRLPEGSSATVELAAEALGAGLNTLRSHCPLALPRGPW